MSEEHMFGGIVLLIVLAVASLGGYVTYQYWNYHQELRKQGVVTRFEPGRAVFLRVDKLPLENPE